VPDKRRSNCQLCRRHRDEVGPISWGGYCSVCGGVLYRLNMDGLHEKFGEPLRRWRRGMAKSVGAVLVDDMPHNP
jgi:hypothetical protein